MSARKLKSLRLVLSDLRLVLSEMSSSMKYPEWQEQYLAAIMEMDVAQLPAKVFQAEAAIFNRYQSLSSRNGNAEERNALAIAIEGLRVLKTKRLNHPDWHYPSHASRSR